VSVVCVEGTLLFECLEVALQSVLKLDGHTLKVTGLAWSKDATRLASGSADGTVIVWDLGAQSMLRR
jgi:WD40 repeat protein